MLRDQQRKLQKREKPGARTLLPAPLTDQHSKKRNRRSRSKRSVNAGSFWTREKLDLLDDLSSKGFNYDKMMGRFEKEFPDGRLVTIKLLQEGLVLLAIQNRQKKVVSGTSVSIPFKI